MPRTAEHLVRCHELASERRAQGKPIWSATFDFSGIRPEGTDKMPSDLTDEQCKELGKKYAEFIRRHHYVTKEQLLEITADGFDEELDTIVDNLEAIGSYPELSALEDLNGQLEMLYDWADMNRAWVTGFQD